MTDIQRADGVRPEPVAWLWEELIPRGMLTLVAGRPDAGKSLWAAWFAAHISRTGRHVVFSNREDPIPQVVVPRLIALGAKLDHISFYSPTLPIDTDRFEEVIKETKAVAFICDPIAAHLTASIYNDQDVRTVLSPLSKIAWETKCAMIMIHHTIKHTADGHPLRSIGGSGGGLTGAARTAYIFGPSPEDEDDRVLAPAKFNLGPRPMSALFEMDEYEWIVGTDKKAKVLNAGRLVLKNTTSKISAEKVLSTSSGLITPKTQDKKADAAEWVTNYLSYGSRKQSEIAEDSLQHGVTFRTLRRAAEEIEVIKERRGFGTDGFWLWSLPEGHPAIIPQCCKRPWVTTDDNLKQKCENCKADFGLTGMEDNPKGDTDNV